MPFINKGYFLQCNALRGFQITGGIPAGVARIFLKKKYLVNYGYDYSYVARIEGKYIQSIVFPLLTKLICFGASRILVSSSRFKKNIYTPLSQARVTTIPNGVDTKLFKPSNAKEKADLRVLYVGRLEREKNLTNLLESTVGIPNVNLTLVGSGSLETELKNVARKLNIKVNFVKKLDYHKLAKFYRQFDIFILPSFTEGHSKVLLEAQASGLVCIASNIQGNREIITNNKNGLLCSLDSQSINKSLTTVVKDRNLRERLSKSARSNAQRKFEISKLLEKEVLIIKSLAN